MSTSIIFSDFRYQRRKTMQLLGEILADWDLANDLALGSADDEHSHSEERNKSNESLADSTSLTPGAKRPHALQRDGGDVDSEPRLKIACDSSPTTRGDKIHTVLTPPAEQGDLSHLRFIQNVLGIHAPIHSCLISNFKNISHICINVLDQLCVLWVHARKRGCYSRFTDFFSWFIGSC